MAWRIELTETAAKQLGNLDKHEAKRITRFLRERLESTEDPRTAGKALTGPQLGTYWRYRVGDYRVICDIRDQVLVILVIGIGNRRDVYK